MRVLITGGAGFLGSHLCDRFLGEGHTVIAVDNFITGRQSNIKHLADHDGFSFIEHDVSKHIDVDGALDVVMHFASPASPIDYLEHPIATLKVGALGTHNALGLAKAKDAKFFLASTSEIYGDPQVHPQPESYWGHVNTIGPRGVYDEAKRYAEAMTMAYYRRHNIDTRIVRIFNTYGPRMRLNDGRAAPAFISQALRGEALTVFGDGTQTRSFCYYEDLIEGIFRLLASDEHYPVNLGNTAELSMLELAEFINDITGNSAGIIMQPEKRIEDDPQTRRPDLSKAKRVLDWEPKVPLEEGLHKTIDHFRTRI